MPSPTIEDRLEAIEKAVNSLNLADLAEQLAKLTAIMESEKVRPAEKEFYSVSETAEMLGKSEYQVRHWCKNGRIVAKKRASGHGPHKEWMIPSDEIKAYQSLGLRPPKAG